MIDKVITVFQDVDTMELINELTGINVFATDNWVDYSIFEEYPELQSYVSKDEYNLLATRKIDYIVFRME